MALRLKRGSTADRTQLYFEEGELVYDVDLEQVFVGNGLQSEGGTIGGVAVGSGAGGSITGITDNTTQSVITLTDVQSTFSNDIFLDTGTILTGTGDIDLDGSINTDSFLTVAGNITTQGNLEAVDIDAANIVATGSVSGALIGPITTGSLTTVSNTLVVDNDGTNGSVLVKIQSQEDRTVIDLVRESTVDISGDFTLTYGSIGFGRNDINGEVTTTTIFGRSNGLYFGNDSDGTLNSLNNYMVWVDNRLGVRTTTPTEALDVRGSAVISGRLVANEISGDLVADDSSIIFDSATGKIPYTALGAGTASAGDVLKYDGAGWIASPDLQGTGGGAANVSGATQASPIVITTAAAHNFGDGQKVTFTDVVGMTELNGNSYFVDTLTIDTFALYSDAALTTPVDGSAFTAYVSGGSAAPAPSSDAVTLDGQFPSYYLDYTNFTNTPTIPTATSQLTNDAGFISSETNDLTANVTWANIPDQNVPASAVTQHQAALQITESQISDLQSYLTAADIGSFTFTSSVLDTSDSSPITITPAVTIQSDLNVENDLVVTNKITADTLEVTNLITAGAGTPELESETEILLTAGTRVEVTQSPLKMASFTTAQRDALTAQNGDIIYNSTDNKFQGYENGAWVNLI